MDIDTHPFIDLLLRFRSLCGSGIIKDVEEFRVEVESYLICLLDII